MDTNFDDINLGALDGSVNSMTKDEFVAEIIPKLQTILDAEFPNDKAKRTIKIYRDRISFAAPCCGDSSHDSHKKRGNIILEGRFRNMYKCHNCGTCMSIYNFFKRYGQSLSLGSIGYVSSTTVKTSTTAAASAVNLIYDVSSIENLAIDREFFRASLGLEGCDVPNEGHRYLCARSQYDFSKFLYSPKYNKLFILNLTPSGKIFGMQVRSLDKNFTGAKYKTYGLRKIYETVFRQNIEIPDNIDSISMIFNILLVDYNSPVTVVEGPMDSFLIRNSIALLGAGKHIDFPFQHRYMFDDDDTGRKHAIESMSDGYDVFLWSKFRGDIGLPSAKKWDMNDVVNWARKNNVKLPWLDGYFSSDILDVMYI